MPTAPPSLGGASKLPRVKFAIPKGSLWNSTKQILIEAFHEFRGDERTYRPTINDPDIELKILRPQEIPLYVEAGYYDVGITGLDWLKETKADVSILTNLEYGHVKIVAAAPSSSPYNTLDEMLRDYIRLKGRIIISTEYLNIASEYVASLPSYKMLCKDNPTIITPWWTKKGDDKVRIYLSFGATEAKPPEEADAIIDVSVTGDTLIRNGLKPLDVIIESSAILIANKESLKSNRKEKILDIATLLRGVVESRKKLHIFVNVKEQNLGRLISLLPALKGPTVSRLSKRGWYAVNTVIDRDVFLKILPDIRRLAQGLVVHNPRMILLLEEAGDYENC